MDAFGEREYFPISTGVGGDGAKGARGLMVRGYNGSARLAPGLFWVDSLWNLQVNDGEVAEVIFFIGIWW